MSYTTQDLIEESRRDFVKEAIDEFDGSPEAKEIESEAERGARLNYADEIEREIEKVLAANVPDYEENEYDEGDCNALLIDHEQQIAEAEWEIIGNDIEAALYEARDDAEDQAWREARDQYPDADEAGVAQ